MVHVFLEAGIQRISVLYCHQQDFSFTNSGNNSGSCHYMNAYVSDFKSLLIKLLTDVQLKVQ